MNRWTAPWVVGLWIAGCGFFDFPAPEHAPEDQGGAGEGGTRTSGGGTSGASGTSGAAGEPGNGGTGGDSPEGGASGAAGVGDGGTAGANGGGTAGASGGGTAGAPTGGKGGDGGGGAGPTEPVMTGLKLWLDAASLTEGGLATWPNRVANGEPDATQPATMTRPEVATLDGRRGVSFDGTQWMTFAEGFASFDAGLTFFLVARFDAPGVCTEIFQVSNGQEIDDISVQSDVMVTDPGVLLFEVANTNMGTGPGVLGGADPMLASIVVRPPQSASLFIDTVPGAMRTDPLFVPASIVRMNNFLGSGLYLNCDPFEGVIFELLLYNRGLSEEDVTLVNAYLQQKWECCDG